MRASKIFLDGGHDPDLPFQNIIRRFGQSTDHSDPIAVPPATKTSVKAADRHRTGIKRRRKNCKQIEGKNPSQFGCNFARKHIQSGIQRTLSVPQAHRAQRPTQAAQPSGASSTTLQRKAAQSSNTSTEILQHKQHNSPAQFSSTILQHNSPAQSSSTSTSICAQH